MEFLLIALVIGCIPGAIAQSKGYSFGLWWLYGAALFIVALPHSLFLRERNRPRIPIPVVIAEGMTTRPANASSGATPRVVAVPAAAHPPASTKTCPMCAETVQAAARICRFCRHEFAADAPMIEATPITPTTAMRGPTDPPRPRLGHVPFGMKPCPSCGTHNWHDAATCTKCGTSFALATPARPDTPARKVCAACGEDSAAYVERCPKCSTFFPMTPPGGA